MFVTVSFLGDGIFQYGGEPCSESAKTHIKVTEKWRVILLSEWSYVALINVICKVSSQERESGMSSEDGRDTGITWH
jgi:hypothetical protein